MGISAKYGLGYAAAIALLVGIAAAAYVGQLRYRDAQDSAERADTTVAELEALWAHLIEAESGQRGFVITGSQEYLDQYRDQPQLIAYRLNALRPLVAGEPAMEGLYERLRRDLTERLTLSKAAIARREDAGFEAAAMLVAAGNGKRLTDGIRDIIDEIEAVQRSAAATAKAGTAASFELVQRMSLYGALAAAVLVLAAGYVMTRRMTMRVQELLAATRALGSGDFSFTLEPQGNDEIAAIGRAVNDMAINLKQSRDALNAFAYTVSHDLRAPLRAMQGFSQALLEDCYEQLDAGGRDCAHRISNAARRMDELLNDILVYSRVDREHMDLQPVSLESVVDEVLASMAQNIADAKAVVSVDRPLPVVVGCRPVLEQAVTNLVSNAVKFTKRDTIPDVRVSAQSANGTVRLSVSDNGIGIEPDHFERVFNVFERLHGVETYPGTGIGLAIVRKGIERMGGRAGVESAPGEGSQFWIELPSGEHA